MEGHNKIKMTLELDLNQREKIMIFKDLFRGRENVFAKRWQKADKTISGYTPVCLHEWKRGLCVKLQKGKCKDCSNKKYIPLNDFHIEQHLRGYATYGIYPLPDDNTSYFIAADFDGKNWPLDVKKFVVKCNASDLSAYVERSQSGNGAHVWLFFTDKYPAYKSRNIVVNILKETGFVDTFEKEESFDRLFPNQEVLSGHGLGNLIMLPLQGQARKENNTIFLDHENEFQPYNDQWCFLKEIVKIPLDLLDSIYEKFNGEDKQKKSSTKTRLQITLKEQIFVNKNNLPKILVNFLLDHLNFINTEYLIRKRIGVSVYGIEKYFKLIQTKKDQIAIPRGFLNKLLSFLDEQNIRFDLSDERLKLEPIKIESGLKLFDYQKDAIENMIQSENGILVAPSGSGKTVIGIELITKLKQPTMILVHKKQIFDQWHERIESFLNIPSSEIGRISATKKKVGKQITIAMVQTLSKLEKFEELSNKFGMIIVDECHHMPARMFRNVITKFSPYYLYGLTATPERKNNDVKLIFIYLGDILYKIEQDFRVADSQPDKNEFAEADPKVVIKITDIEVPFKVKTDNFQILSKIIAFDSIRNNQIVADIKEEINKGSRCLVLTERKEHVEVLSCYLKHEHEIISLTGDSTDKQRKMKIKQILEGHFQILIATGQLVGEGADFHNLDCLFLVYPFAFSGKMTQYIGRIQRGHMINKMIYDYRDIKVEYLEKLFKKRLNYYKKRFNFNSC